MPDTSSNPERYSAPAFAVISIVSSSITLLQAGFFNFGGGVATIIGMAYCNAMMRDRAAEAKGSQLDDDDWGGRLALSQQESDPEIPRTSAPPYIPRRPVTHDLDLEAAVIQA
ncbi:hypothetical protein RUND412_001664 [Rhizina undulata]